MTAEIAVLGPPGGDPNEKAWIEDEIEELLGDAGEIVGAGAGIMGWDIHLELNEGEDWQKWVERIRTLLRELRVRREIWLGVFPPNDEDEGTYHRVGIFDEESDLA